MIRRGCSVVHALALCALLGGAACTKADSPAASPPPTKSTGDPAKYSFYMVNFPFGGQRPEWWEEQITQARPGGAHADAKRHALLLERAKRNGLAVTEQDGAVLVRPDDATTALLLEKLQVK